MIWITTLLSSILLGAPTPKPGAGATEYDRERERMVEHHLKRRDIDDPHVLRAMRAVDRHALVPEALRGYAYADRPLPIGHEQTISQPYIVALMTQLAQVKPGMKVLDVGTGSGYQAAVLAEVVGEKGHVYSVEIVCPLAERAEAHVKQKMGYENVTIQCRDGWKGWPEHAPFDAIVLAAAPPEVPPALTRQLKTGARLVLPVGVHHQELVVLEKQADGTLKREQSIPVRFVPMTGEAQKKKTM